MSVKKYIGFQETLNKKENAFLLKQAKEAQSSFIKVFHTVMLVIVFFLVLLYTIANFTYDPYKVYEKHETPLTPSFVINLSFILVAIFGTLIGFAYYFAIYSLFKEVKNGYKIVAQVSIKRKMHMKQNNTYHLFLNNFFKKSIEVESAFYNMVDVNDEINIEFLPTSEKILGYY